MANQPELLRQTQQEICNYVGRGVEADHLKAKFVDNDPNLEEMEQVVLLKEQNKSLRAIAKELGQDLFELLQDSCVRAKYRVLLIFQYCNYQ